jgi:hypothetical protein
VAKTAIRDDAHWQQQPDLACHTSGVARAMAEQQRQRDRRLIVGAGLGAVPSRPLSRLPTT